MALTVLTTLEIPANQSLSNGLDCIVGRIVRIGMPSDWTPAPTTFQIMPEYGLDYFDLFSVQVTTGAFTPYEAVIPTITPNTMLYLPPDTGLSVRMDQG